MRNLVCFCNGHDAGYHDKAQGSNGKHHVAMCVMKKSETSENIFGENRHFENSPFESLSIIYFVVPCIFESSNFYVAFK